ncbi:hypothetical protein I316_00118 [Kwoniella heveanensis BCC8398]|uniref:Uncharacterized protein n=1 Tax=Kwoniella heveanensis BCC8398 TaxID=1296120 RepID=A0A1B9H3P0_9TREE|nr:hypothetical protein I316_00118 [Kwoniella heveanensis BCC8398]
MADQDRAGREPLPFEDPRIRERLNKGESYDIRGWIDRNNHLEAQSPYRPAMITGDFDAKPAHIIYQIRIWNQVQADKANPKSLQVLDRKARMAYDDWLPKVNPRRAYIQLLMHPTLLNVHKEASKKCSECHTAAGRRQRGSGTVSSEEESSSDEDSADDDPNDDPFSGVDARKARKAQRDQDVDEWNRKPKKPEKRHVANLPCVTINTTDPSQIEFTLCHEKGNLTLVIRGNVRNIVCKISVFHTHMAV